jgi:hypothetical protein
LKSRTLIKLAIAFVAIAVLVVWVFSTQPSAAFYISSGWLIIIAVMLWWGNKGLTHGLDRILPWSRWGNFRFFVHLLLGLIYLLALVNLSYLVLKIILNSPPTIEQIVVMNAWGAFIFIPVFAIYFSLHFLKHWRKSELEVEKFQKENMRSQLDLLKSHLDPHFLFNNLNILSSLIDKDQNRSRLFVEHFADVYRSMLRTKADDLIPLAEEIEFIESYIYLIRTRFEDNIQFTIDLKKDQKNLMVPPLTVQMLIENAIKHNNISEKDPLRIHLLQTEDRYLIVRNTLKEKKEPLSSDGSGLLNIQRRYAHFTSNNVKVIRSDTHFEVQIPLLEIEHL